jgi:hypothetical protein
MKLIYVFCFLLLVTNSFSQKKNVIQTELDTILTSELGEAVVLKKEIKLIPQKIVIKESFITQSGLIKFQHEAGDIYPFQTTTESYNCYFSLTGKKKNGWFWGILIDKNNPSTIVPCITGEMLGNEIIPRKGVISSEMIEPKQFMVTDCEDCLMQELIYRGVVGNILKFTYREFIGDYARPSFFQELEYDIKSENIVGFKGARVEILQTSNTSIKYKVKKIFSSNTINN